MLASIRYRRSTSATAPRWRIRASVRSLRCLTAATGLEKKETTSTTPTLCKPATAPPVAMDTYCVYQTTYSQNDCSGAPMEGQGFVFFTQCDYCQEDFGGGTMGIRYYCNSTGFSSAVCEDYACGICPSYGYLPFRKCFDGVVYDAIPCPDLFFEQLYGQPDCGGSENAIGPMIVTPTPLVRGNITCEPLY